MSNKSHTLIVQIIPSINVGMSSVILHRANRVISSSFDDEVDVLTYFCPLSGSREAIALSWMIITS